MAGFVDRYLCRSAISKVKDPYDLEVRLVAVIFHRQKIPAAQLGYDSAQQSTAPTQAGCFYMSREAFAVRISTRYGHG